MNSAARIFHSNRPGRRNSFMVFAFPSGGRRRRAPAAAAAAGGSGAGSVNGCDTKRTWRSLSSMRGLTKMLTNDPKKLSPAPRRRWPRAGCTSQRRTSASRSSEIGLRSPRTSTT